MSDVEKNLNPAKAVKQEPLTFDQVTSFFLAKGVSPKCTACGASIPRIHSEKHDNVSPVSVGGLPRVELFPGPDDFTVKPAGQYFASVLVECGNCGNVQNFSYKTISEWVAGNDKGSEKNGK